jgi:hypothetical protein
MFDREAGMESERLGFDIKVEVFEKATARLRAESRNIGFG